jgi:hypothetical protein
VHRFVLAGRVIVVGVVNRNQILSHDFSYKGLLPWVETSSTALRAGSFIV